MRHARQVGEHRRARDVLAERERQRGVGDAERLRLEQLAQEHLLAPRVGQLDADGVAARHRRRRARRRRPCERARSSASPITRADLTPRAGSNSWSVTTGPGCTPLTSPLTPKSASTLGKQPRLAAQLGLRDVRPRLGRRRPPQQAERRAAARRLAAACDVRRRLGWHVEGGCGSLVPRPASPRRRRARSAWRSRGSSAPSIDRTTRPRPGARHVLVGSVLVGRFESRRARRAAAAALEMQRRRLAQRGGSGARGASAADAACDQAMQLSPPAGHGFEAAAATWSGRSGLSSLLRQAEAAHQHHQAGGEIEQPRGGGGAIGVDVGEQARQQAEAEIAEHAAIAW